MKKYIFGLIGIIGLGLINFSSATFTVVDTIGESGSLNLQDYGFSSGDFVCLSGDAGSIEFYFGMDSLGSDLGTNGSMSTSYGDYFGIYLCVPFVEPFISDFNFNNNFYSFRETNTELIKFTPGSNGTGSSESDCPVFESTFSTLFVNGTQITGSSNIYISTPDHFEYTPTYYTGYMDLEIVNVGDPDYIESLIDIQTNKPDEIDLNNIITGLVPLFVKGFVIILFIYFVFRLIKKIF